jgi:hypothetical protein
MAKPEMRPPDMRKSNPQPASPEQQAAPAATAAQEEDQR